MIVFDKLEIRRLFSTFYVSSAGSNTGDGSLAHPFATIQFAASLTHAGDVVNVDPGEYAGFILGWDPSGVYGPINGTATAPITIQGEPGAVINSRNNKTPIGIDLEPGNSFVNIEGFTVASDGSITSYGIKVAQSDNINILNNTVTLAGKSGIFTAFSSNDLIQGNVSFNNGEHGIYVSNSPANVRIIGNYAIGNANCGIQINADANQGGTGLAEDCVIATNEIINNGLTGGAGLNFDGLQNSFIENNVLIGNRSSGIALFRQDAAGGSMNNVIANNTVDMAADARSALEISNGSTGNLIFNNILLDANPDRGDISIDASSAAGTESDHNILAGIESLNGNTISLAQWQMSTGQDLHSITSTLAAVFANPAANNFHLVNGSPALGIGVSIFGGIAAPNTDFQGHYWTGGIYDAGAYHFQVRTVNGDLIVIGSTGNDTISFNLIPGDLVDVQINAQDKGQFPEESLSLIKAFGGLGNDTIGVDPNIQVRAKLVGGTGNNIMAASSAADTLIGQGGNDTLISHGNGALLVGGGGDNLIYALGEGELIYAAMGSSNTVYGGAGQDTLHALGQVSIPDDDISLILQG